MSIEQILKEFEEAVEEYKKIVNDFENNNKKLRKYLIDINKRGKDDWTDQYINMFTDDK